MTAALRGAILVAALTAVGGCRYIISNPVQGYERDPVACSNGIDDDGDGAIDCEDPDCWIYTNLCGQVVPPNIVETPAENTYDLCTDGIDNDGNGSFDCGETSCQNIHETCCSLEFDDVTCSDGVDNDGNGFADCEDFSCKQGIFVHVCSEKRDQECSDHKDNDGNGKTDCEDSTCNGLHCDFPTNSKTCQHGKCEAIKPCVNDVDPTTGQAVETSLAACSDGCDNDGNGFVDCNDFSCSKSPDPAVKAFCDSQPHETDVSICTKASDCGTAPTTKNGGVVACVDGFCNNSPCSNGIDEDGNGFVDCADFSCTKSSHGATNNAITFCQHQPHEDSITACKTAADCKDNPASPVNGAIACVGGFCNNSPCSDGVDNDGNGFVDCADFGCSKATDPNVLAYCAPREENTFAKCKDGIDNDGNGFVDCDDHACSQAKDPNVRVACQESAAPNPQDPTKSDPNFACSDGKDNDGDGFIDCDDWDCAWNPDVTVCKGHPRPCDYAAGARTK